MANQYDADVIVIGSGTVGSNAAYELAKQGKSVIILEAGVRIPRWKLIESFRNSPRRQDYNGPYPDQPWAHTSSSHEYVENVGGFPMVANFLKLVGGSTWHWGGATWRFIPDDFKMKSTYGVGRDWPISYDDLEPWYVKAEWEIGVAGNMNEDQSGARPGQTWPPRSKDFPMPAQKNSYMLDTFKNAIAPMGYDVVAEPSAMMSGSYRGRPGCVGNNNCAPVCPIGANYSGVFHADLAVEAGCKLITDATVDKIIKGADGKIEAVHYKSSDGSEATLSAKTFVLAAHGYESPKLLIMSDVGNKNDMVGRNLMPHLGLGVDFFSEDAVWPGRGPIQQGAIFTYRDGESRSRHSGMKHAVNNFVPNENITKRLLKKGVLGSQLDDRIRHDSARYMSLYTMFETLPDPANRVQPGDKTDALGNPNIRLTYNVDDYARGAIDPCIGDYQKFVQAMNGETLNMSRDLANHDHIMGTTIMGASAEDSVVDKDCRSWEHENLFIVGTGNLPSSSVVNPTLTAVALAIRAADTIAKEV
ncbi:GMC family oxidoreductase [Pseudooceanicola sp. CBS1P-1]|uniref:FAD-binding protein n=1 Tax=Pseudooceanicola albus TaxID=2692189 RepID=A0A6L7G1T3_9RHOB|nr:MULTISPECIES: GMC family oxidoreductase [Pseudooceanicola]MBT9383575.1 GMC family oxidoreductase [Pseudooceanicola endophyticus]MXN17430.1 FAD-binding protein [Pseudooceanicola albus]